MFSSIIMIIFLLATSVKIKHQNSFTMDISGLASILIQNNSASLVLLVCDLNHNITSLTDLSRNFLFPIDYRIPFLWTLSRNSYHPLDLTLSWSLLTGLPSRQFLFLSTTPSCLFILYVFSKHSISSYITSDRDSKFVLNFFYLLDTALDIWLHFTLGYHPESDRQTKHTNQIFEQYLHIYCNYQQDNQSKLLLLVEFSYNNTPSATTGASPFFTNKGYYLNISIHSECNIASS